MSNGIAAAQSRKLGVWRALGAAVAAGALLAACGQSGETGKASGQVFTVVVDGSSSVFPISEAAGEGFMKDMAGRALVTVSESGTGGGFKKFCRDEVHVQGASRPILAGEIAACREAGVAFIELPIAFDALSVVVHPSNPLTEISVEDLKKAWEPAAQGKVSNWRQINPKFPDLALTLYGPGTASGTFDYFTEAVVGKADASRTDYTPSEDDNVLVQGLSSDRGGLGYFGMAYYTENKERVRALGISYRGQPAVYPTKESVQSGAYQPLARPLFIYVNAKALDRPPVRAFIDYYLKNASALADRVGFVGLPAEAYAAAEKRIADRSTGTGFGGVQDIGGNIQEVLARPLSNDVGAPAPSEAPKK